MTIRSYLRAVGMDPGGTGPSDADLITRFGALGDEGAFELLVWRHAPLVQRVCRSVLHDHHAAEDAAQATFLILARRAKTFTGRGSVVGWLYRVARRVSVRLAKQRARLPVGADLDRVPAPVAPDHVGDAGALWEEVTRLPERYRVPVLLCFFEGLTHAEAARRAGLPVGTIAGQLARAKDLLAKRLSRRGVTLRAVALPVVSGAFVGSTAQAATAFVSGRGVANLVPPAVLHLAQGAMQSMVRTMFKSAVVVAVVCAAAAAGSAFMPGAPVTGDGASSVAPPVEPGASAGSKGADKASDGIADTRQRVRSLNNLRQIILAVHNYHDANGFFPRDVTDKNGKALLSWRVLLLPYLEQEALYKSFKLDEPWDSENNKKLAEKMPDVFRVGIEGKGATKTYYQVFAGPGTAFEPGQKLTFAGITDGTVNTLGIVEAGPPVEWTKPADIAYDPQKAFPKLDGPFRNVLMVSTMDGSVYAFKPDLKGETLHHFVTRAGGEVADIAQAKADSNALSKEDKELAAKFQKENLELIQKLGALLTERQKMVTELMKKFEAGGPDLERLVNQQERLRRELESLRVEIEALKKELNKK